MENLYLPVLILCSMVGCSEFRGASTGRISSRLMDSQETRAVVALRDAEGDVVCSGVVVSHEKVLTAAHCLGTPGLQVVFQNGEHRAPLATRLHPDFLADDRTAAVMGLQNDLALVTISDIPDGVVPMAPDFSPVPESLRVLAFPRADGAAQGGLPEVGDATARLRFQGRLFDAFPKAGSCLDDAGSVAVAVRQGGLSVVGIGSFGFDDSCQGAVQFTPLSAHRKWLEAALAGLPDLASGNATSNFELSPMTDSGLISAATPMSLSGGEEPWCYPDFIYNTTTKLCENGEQAVGPFPPAMVQACKDNLGGDACDGLFWHKEFARSLRGTDPCPAGSWPQDGLCVDGVNAYGPFPAKAVRKCAEQGIGRACFLARWNATLARDLVGVAPAISPSDEYAGIQKHIMNAYRDLRDNQAGLGYRMTGTNSVIPGHTRDLYYGGVQIWSIAQANTRKSHCSGITYQLLIEALNHYADEDNSSRVWNMSAATARGSFKTCWYSDAGCRGASDALPKFGIGKEVSFSQAQPGDFINLDRSTGSGHSVMFLAFLHRVNGKITESETYDSNVVGFRYFSSQPSTNGTGRRRAYFEGYCNQDDPWRDCKVFAPSHRYGPSLGRVAHPSQFR